MKNKRKALIIALTLILVMMLTFGLVACANPDDNNSQTPDGDKTEVVPDGNNSNDKTEVVKQVPVYLGMNIEKITLPTNSNGASMGLTDIVEDVFDGDYIGKEDNIFDEDPFGEKDEEDIHTQIEDSLVVEGAAEKIYYAEKEEDILVKINLSNPDKFEILSFTLNGYKYANNMFEKGSTLDTIIIKVNVGKASGIREFTIDAIKYIDGTEIKDVLLNGDKTVKAGIYSADQVKATVTNVITETNSYSFDVNIVDKNNLVNYSNGYLKAVLYDGTSLVSKKDLVVGDNSVKFDNLKTTSLYEVAIVGVYDNLKEGKTTNVLYRKAFYTDKIVLFDRINVGSESIKFDFSWNKSVSDKTISKLTLVNGKDVVELDKTTNVVSGLLSNHEYSLVAEYKNGTKQEKIQITFTTKQKVAPTYKIENVVAGSKEVSFNINVVDDSSIGIIDKIYVTDGENVINATSTEDRKIQGLNSNTKYSLVVEYSYNLNEGDVDVKNTIKCDFTTKAFVDIVTTSVTNSIVTETEKIVLDATISNPDNAEILSFVINGKEYPITHKISSTKVKVDLLNKGQFETGLVSLSVEKIKVKMGSEEYFVPVVKINNVEITIKGAPKLVSFDVVNGNTNSAQNTDICFDGEKVYAKVTLNTDSENITSFKLKLPGYEQYKDVSEFTADGSSYYFELTEQNNPGETSVHLSSITYGDNKVILANEERYFYKATGTRSINYISTAEELKNIANGKYYELKNDIDLAGSNWTPVEFNGYLNGKGHNIKNLTYTGESSSDVALFSTANGVINNVNMVGVYYDIEANGYIKVSVFSNNLTGRIVNSTIDSTSQITATLKDEASEVSVYGFAVNRNSYENCKMQNCTNNANIYADGSAFGFNKGGEAYNCVNNGDITGKDYVAGIGSDTCINCINNGTIKGEQVVGGILAEFYSISNVQNCTNNGDIIGIEQVGGIGAYCDFIINCVNNGSVKGKTKVGGILAMAPTGGSDVFVKLSLNTGKIKGEQYVGGIVGGKYDEGVPLEISNCVNVGEVVSTTGDSNIGSITGMSAVIKNSHTTNKINNGEEITAASLTKDFFIEKANFDKNIWNLDNIDIANKKYPTIK